MSLKELTPGKYIGIVDSWGIVDVPSMDTFKAVIKFQIKDTQDIISWDGFFTKRNGEPNKKTLKALKACGFKSRRIKDFANPEALDRGLEVQLDIIREDGYLRVDWVNTIGGPETLDLATAQRKLASLKIDAALGSIQRDDSRAKKADELDQALGIDSDEEIPF